MSLRPDLKDNLTISINGFGRIGRCVLRALTKTPEFKSGKLKVAAINDLTDSNTLAHLLRYDSVHGRFAGDVAVDGDSLVVDGKKIKVSSERDPAKLPWKDHGVDIVLECSGAFKKREVVAGHLRAGAKKVIYSAPLGDADFTLVMGINNAAYDPDTHDVVSNASCTTNCLAPVVKVIDDNFGVENGTMTTIHSYTNDQRILDLPHSDMRRARAAALSMIPTTTGAAKAVGLVLPHLKGKIDGMAIRVPTPNVSVVDFVCQVKNSTTADVVNAAFQKASKGELEGILSYCDEPLVSTDFNGSPESSIVDAQSTLAIGSMVKVLAWYDNEWGFSNRMIDLTFFMGSKL
jgi:glyceraldehyde 3-phosphate dehydrogenase